MSLTESNMMELGTEAPDFALLDTLSGKEISLADLKSEQATVIMFTCNHCPYVLHVNAELVRLSTEYMAKGVSFVAISSNDVDKYPQDAPDNGHDSRQKAPTCPKMHSYCSTRLIYNRGTIVGLAD